MSYFRQGEKAEEAKKRRTTKECENFCSVASEILAEERAASSGGRLLFIFSSFWSSLGSVFGGSTDNEEGEEEEIDLEMASRAVANPDNHPRVGAKQKNGREEAKTRRVLRDIGNLAIAPPVETKNNNQITRRVTRSFGAQILANAQAAAQKNPTKKPLLENVGKNASKKTENVAKNESAIVIISSDEEEVPKSERKTRKESKNKAEKSFTSILTARSKAACGLTKKPPVILAEDIDAADKNNELAAVEYLDDMYTFYKEAEGENPIQNYIDTQPEINGKMRAILVDWLIEVHRKFELMPESLYLTVNILDRFLSLKTVSRRELQLVGISSMLIACKYEEIWAPEVNDFVAISDNAYIREQVLVMEKTILEKLDWYLTVPTCYVFLVRFAKASIPSDSEMDNMTFFFAELGLSNYSTIIEYSPSKLSAAAVYAARCTLKRSPKWTETLKHYTGYAEDQLMECAKSLIGLHVGEVDSKLRAVNRKYSDPSRRSVALFPPACSFLLTDCKTEEAQV